MNPTDLIQNYWWEAVTRWQHKVELQGSQVWAQPAPTRAAVEACGNFSGGK